MLRRQTKNRPELNNKNGYNLSIYILHTIAKHKQPVFRFTANLGSESEEEKAAKKLCFSRWSVGEEGEGDT